MKKILLFTLFYALSLGVHAQTYVQLKADTADIWVGQYQHPKNTLRARWVDTDSTLAIIGTDNTVFAAARKYNAYVDATSSPFISYAALKAWVLQYFFVDASANGGGGSEDLQSATDLGNATSNAIQVTGANKLSLTNSLSLLRVGNAGGIYNITGSSPTSYISFDDHSNGIELYPNGTSNLISVRFHKTSTTGDLIADFDGRVAGSNAVQSNEFATLSQVTPMPVNIVSTDTLTVNKGGTYTFTGSVAKSWKMPSVSAATGMTIFIINRGSAALTINSNAGTSDLDVNGVYSTNIIIAAGENYVLRGNSLKLVTVNN